MRSAAAAVERASVRSLHLRGARVDARLPDPKRAREAVSESKE
jgi:hypothetical protein